MSMQTVIFSQIHQWLVEPSKINQFALFIVNNVSSQINTLPNKLYHSRQLGLRSECLKAHFEAGNSACSFTPEKILFDIFGSKVAPAWVMSAIKVFMNIRVD